MYIGIHDADKEHIKNKKFPNFALMKISAYHKHKGDIVEWWNPLMTYDRVYSSKIFDFTPENPYLPSDVIRGGTGYDIHSKLPDEIDKMFPDYSIYPDCDYAIGFITRGCPNNCSWCYVPDKEGKIRPYKSWRKIVRKDSDKLVLMDNNILASKYGIKQLQELSRTNYKIDLNQGIDIRLVTEDIVKLFKELSWIKYIRFSCDQKSQLHYFEQVLKWFVKYGVSRSKIFVYVLVQQDIEDAEYRVHSLHGMFKSINIYAQAERNEGKGIIPSKLQLEFAQKYIYGRLYKKESWDDYCKRHSLI